LLSTTTEPPQTNLVISRELRDCTFLDTELELELSHFLQCHMVVT